MDAVLNEFSQRVLATRKCCESNKCFCDHSLFITPNWSQTKGTKNQRLMLYIGFVDGKWKHGFCDYERPFEALSLDNLVKLPNAKKHVRVCWIGLMAAGNYPSQWNHDVVDMKKLLKVVSFLSNEPELCMDAAGSLDLPGGELLSAWLQESSFSGIQIDTLTSDRIYRKVLEKQFSRRKPTAISVNQIRGNEHFLAERVMSGDLRRLCIYDHDFKFPSAVLEQIERTVLNDPEDYHKNKLDIRVCFATPAKELMDRLTGRAQHSTQQQTTSYKFKRQSLILERFRDCWHLFSV